jgi:uncharacterized protein YecT (DUF1311 family)
MKPCLPIAALLAGLLLPPMGHADQVSSGSGFAVAGGAYVLTNAHVVQGCDRIDLSSGGTASIKVIDSKVDLALLQPSQRIAGSLPFRSGRQARLGEEVVVIGFPLPGLLSSGPQVTTGIVSALAGIQNDRTRLQITAPVQPGNSGGPVLDRFGNVVGIVVSKLDAMKAELAIGDIPQNINFAIQGPIVMSFLDSYSIDYQSVTTNIEKSISDVVASSLPGIISIECAVGGQVVVPPPNVPKPADGVSESNDDIPPQYNYITRTNINCLGRLELSEILICKDGRLSRLDGVMGQLYRELRVRLDNLSSHKLLLDQREWIKHRDTNCGLVTMDITNIVSVNTVTMCLVLQTKERIATLQYRNTH